jgi:hypothetical protein
VSPGDVAAVAGVDAGVLGGGAGPGEVAS